MSSIRRIIAFALIATVASTARAQEAGISVGVEAPGAAVTTLDARSVDLAQYFGEKPVVLEFWATWCPLCKKLEPSMQAARERHQNVTFVSVGVAPNQTAERQREYVEKQHLTGEFVFDKDGAAVKAFAVPHTSYIVIVDRNRKVVYTGVGDAQDIELALKKAGL